MVELLNWTNNHGQNMLNVSKCLRATRSPTKSMCFCFFLLLPRRLTASSPLQKSWDGKTSLCFSKWSIFLVTCWFFGSDNWNFFLKRKNIWKYLPLSPFKIQKTKCFHILSCWKYDTIRPGGFFGRQKNGPQIRKRNSAWLLIALRQATDETITEGYRRGHYSHLAISDPEIKPFERLIFPTKYVIPKRFKVWLLAK